MDQADIKLYTYEQFLLDLAKLQLEFPEVEVVSIGRSLEGRNLFAIRLGNGPRRVHYTAGMHANEWLTTPLVMKFCWDYCQCLAQGQPLGDVDLAKLSRSSTIWLTPSVNPDGTQLVQKGISPESPWYPGVYKINQGSGSFQAWKSNIRGVDLNHQFPAGWSIQASRSPKQPSPRDYCGPEPLSEPESLALAGFTREKDFAAVLAFHSQGQIIYWGYEGMEHPQAKALAVESGRLTGYRVVRYAGTHAGYKDWFIQDWRRPGFTVEVGKGKNPLPVSALPAIYRRLARFMAWFPGAQL